MNLTRRKAIAALTSGTALSALSGCIADPVSPKISAAPEPRSVLPNTPSTLFLNKARAADVLAQEKVDLLICSEPRNIYYLTNQRPMTYRLGMNDYTYATLSASNPDRPVFITGRYDLYLGGAADTEVFNELDFKLFSIPEDPVAFSQLTDIQDIINAPVSNAFYPKLHDEFELAPHVIKRRENDVKALSEHFATVEGALLKQVFETDLKHKTIAIDHPKIRESLQKSGLDLQIVDGERLIKKIRMQKTPAELELHRYAISANARSARQAAKSIAEGATLQEMRGEFYRACGDQTMNAVYMVIDGIVPELVPGEIKRGRSLMIDCVSEFQGYHGDFGRTVCVGEPNRKMQQVVDGLSHVWDRLMPMLKVGTKYSELHAQSAKLFAETKLDTGFAINPHSVGLQHTDEPSSADFGLWQKEDISLIENMVLSVDMPILNNGLGGTAHLEDLVLIGKDGPELLNSSDDRLIIV